MSRRPTIDIYCTCGMHAKLTFVRGTTRAVQQRAASRVYAAGHVGAGHQPCDRRTAERAERKEPGQEVTEL